MHNTVPASHAAETLFYPLLTRVLTVPFIYNFFGIPASGDWNYFFSFPNVRIAATKLFVTSSQGNSPSAYAIFTNSPDRA